MKLYKHINYDHYIESQIIKNTKKLSHVWIQKDEMDLLVEYIKQNCGDLSFGICHGVRNGWEVQELIKRLDIKVTGTDIARSVLKYKNTIQWDFHDVKDEWINNVDFIYSNSFDHSYKPQECLNSWMSCIKKEGTCFIHWMQSNVYKIDAADCFAASLKEYRDMIEKKYEVIDEIYKYKNRRIIVIKHKD